MHQRVDPLRERSPASRRYGVEAGRPTTGHSELHDVGADGRFALFESSSSDLAGAVTPGTHLYRRDLVTGEVVAVPFARSIGSGSPATMSDDGRRVAVISSVEAGGSDIEVVAVIDVPSGITWVLTGDGQTALSIGDDLPVAMSADGRTVAYLIWRPEYGATTLSRRDAPPWLIGSPAFVSRPPPADRHRVPVWGGQATESGWTLLQRGQLEGRVLRVLVPRRRRRRRRSTRSNWPPRRWGWAGSGRRTPTAVARRGADVAGAGARRCPGALVVGATGCGPAWRPRTPTSPAIGRRCWPCWTRPAGSASRSTSPTPSRSSTTACWVRRMRSCASPSPTSWSRWRRGPVAGSTACSGWRGGGGPVPRR